MNDFSAKLKTATQSGLAFALFRKPDENQVFLFVNDASAKNNLLLHAFDSKKEIRISDANPLSVAQTGFQFDFEVNLPPSGNFSPLNQLEYEHLIHKTIDTIKQSAIRKIVFSRNKLIENKNYNLLRTFSTLMQQHPSALVYLWHDPNAETWMGASPELLLSQENETLKTVSLAGTKSPDAEWTTKEIEEQQIVTDYILDAMNGLDELSASETQTVQAGKFQHLKTYISAKTNADFDVSSLLKKLHPTPAVCGLPKQAAFDYILKNETYDRGFYTGYIGIENENSKIYFVNLRSARFFRNSIFVYAGGGITADSKPNKEWDETEMKSGTIINALTD